MAMMASLGIAIKVIIVPLAHIITGPLFIPGGVVAGGFYMAFLVLGSSIIQKKGTATVIALIQAVLVTITGTLGSHGAISLLTYTLPGIAVDIVFLLLNKYAYTPLGAFAAGMAANITGSFAVNMAIFNLAFVPLMLSVCAASLSGGLGGLVAYSIGNNIQKLQIINTKKKIPLKQDKKEE